MPRRLFAFFALLVCAHLYARQPERARHAMVVSGDPFATDVGVKILQQGGNAVDAAVAVGFALSVTYPYAGNLGGGGFMLIRFADGHSTFIDFRERAPAKATRDMYLDAKGNPTRDSVEGWRSSGVPGTVRGFELAQKKYGRAKWDRLIAPSIDLASKGFRASYSFVNQLQAARNLASDPESKRIFLRHLEPGDTFTQPDLALTLERIAQSGAKDFYEGETARLMADQMAKNGGLTPNSAAVAASALFGVLAAAACFDRAWIACAVLGAAGLGIVIRAASESAAAMERIDRALGGLRAIFDRQR